MGAQSTARPLTQARPFFISTPVARERSATPTTAHPPRVPRHSMASPASAAAWQATRTLQPCVLCKPPIAARERGGMLRRKCARRAVQPMRLARRGRRRPQRVFVPRTTTTTPRRARSARHADRPPLRAQWAQRAPLPVFAAAASRSTQLRPHLASRS